jgi:DNA-binding MarR family transcriptional regulator
MCYYHFMDGENLNLGAMEFFILALVGKAGLKSLYELRKQAGLEPGGIRSAMDALEERELISRSGPGKRRRRELALTDTGNLLLEENWQHCLREYPEGDAVLRAAFVAWVMAGPLATAVYMNDVGQSRRERAQQMNQEAELMKNSKMEPLSGYAWMRISNEAHRQSAESEAFLSMSGSIQEYLSKLQASQAGQQPSLRDSPATAPQNNDHAWQV